LREAAPGLVYAAIEIGLERTVDALVAEINRYGPREIVNRMAGDERNAWRLRADCPEFYVIEAEYDGDSEDWTPKAITVTQCLAGDDFTCIVVPGDRLYGWSPVATKAELALWIGSNFQRR
jgi:hypothetical protein